MEDNSTLHIPGKWMLAGEYGVLAPGGEALAVAVTPGLRLEVRSSSRWELSRGDTKSHWHEGDQVPTDLSFAHAALQRGLGLQGANRTPLCITIYPGTFAASGTNKSGIGGSAAAVVGVLSALSVHNGGSLQSEEILNHALDVHAEVQGGRGSGYDVATIFTGGVVRWARESRKVTTLDWASDLFCIGGYAKESAHTPTLVDRAHDAIDDTRRILDGVTELADAFQGGRSEDVLNGLASCQNAFRAWNERHKLGLWTGGMERLASIAADDGVVVRSSGAGGGDSVLAFSREPEQLERLSNAWRENGLMLLPFIPAMNGVQLQGEGS